jgi:ribosomal silencing factor RsfS
LGSSEFNDKRILVDYFVMAFTQFSMNFHAIADKLKAFFLEE